MKRRCMVLITLAVLPVGLYGATPISVEGDIAGEVFKEYDLIFNFDKCKSVGTGVAPGGTTDPAVIPASNEEAAVMNLCKQSGTKVSCDQFALESSALIGSDTYETAYQVAGHFMLDASNGATKIVVYGSNAAMTTLLMREQGAAMVVIAKVCSGTYLTVEEYLALTGKQEP